MKTKRILLSILAAVLICAISVGGTLAVLKQQTGPVTNTFMSAGLLSPGGSFSLLEHEAVFNYSTDKYTLNVNKTVSSNEYAVSENTVVPKDPFVSISGKNGVPAYLYVELVHTGNSNFIMNVSSDWVIYSAITIGGHPQIGALQGQLQTVLSSGYLSLLAFIQAHQDEISVPRGPNGGLLYYYTGGDSNGNPKAIVGENGNTNFTIPFLRDNQATVLASSDGKELSGGVTFYAYMVSANNGLDALQAFEAAGFSPAA